MPPASPRFEPGIALCGAFYAEHVRPLLERAFPRLPHSAALLGPGSEVLGCDTATSTDHDWAPRVHVFLAERDAAMAPQVAAALREGLPSTYRDYPVLCSAADGVGGTWMRAWVGSAATYFRRALGWDAHLAPAPADWLATPTQTLLELTSGAVYSDGTGELAPLRDRLAWYPHDVWLYVLAAGWQRVGQEEHLMSRAGTVGDELGSAIVGSRLARDLMGLAYLLERRYAPYAKWFGTLFGRLESATVLRPLLWRAQQAADWQSREGALLAADEYLVRRQNLLGLTAPLADEGRPFYSRPYRVIGGEWLASALCEAIGDPAVRALLDCPLIGSVDQWSDSTDLKRLEWRGAVRRLVGEPPGCLRGKGD